MNKKIKITFDVEQNSLCVQRNTYVCCAKRNPYAYCVHSESKYILCTDVLCPCINLMELYMEWQWIFHFSKDPLTERKFLLLSNR